MSNQIKTRNFAFFSHKECEYFPCHKVKKGEQFNCLFCYCPLYALGDRCGGNFIFTEEDVKDCSRCKIPHVKGGYEYVTEKFDEIVEMTKRKEDDE